MFAILGSVYTFKNVEQVSKGISPNIPHYNFSLLFTALNPYFLGGDYVFNAKEKVYCSISFFLCNQ